MHEIGSREAPAAPAAQLPRRRLLGLLGAASAVAVVEALASPSRASAAVLLGETTKGVDSVEEALAEAAQSAWGGYSNGRVPASALTPVLASVAGSGYLRQDAAARYFDMSLAFASAVGRPLAITEGYRDFARQQDYWNRYQAGTGNLAAYPGTSNHGWGISADFGASVDVAGSTAKRWMDANAPSYGWQPTGNGFSRPEAWHFDYTGAWTGPLTVARDLEVVLVRCTGSLPGVGAGFIATLGIRTMRHMSSTGMVNVMRALDVPYYELSSTAFLDAMDALAVPRSALVGNADYWLR
ncbi:M15 family metallopeptidase [Frigoribacterium sp. PhB116]|uniref:M15 family metallopeptidase n=1 Tax=Frigoribacterium sp. PhB116 TaxID=2485174 RepID=UPI00105E7C8C|nr:M15 family metallopeptidase [Frigoribacterium sp. PhB116]TDT66080.1 D-alanyl-D-alanine carboxypeptidase-like protein [Frigoribacterium sp. PhB116]